MSVTVEINLQGTEEFSQAISRFDSAMRNQVQTQLSNWADSVRQQAERIVPIRTGYLRSTIFAKAQDWQMQVGAEASYAASVEFGTRFMQAKPFLAPAVETHLPQLEKFLLEAISSAKLEAGL